jgi:hypothetical protein
MSAAAIIQMRARSWLDSLIAGFHARRLRREVASWEHYEAQLQRALVETRHKAQAARVRLARWER